MHLNISTQQIQLTTSEIQIPVSQTHGPAQLRPLTKFSNHSKFLLAIVIGGILMLTL